MQTEHYEKIEAYEELLEDLNLQKIEMCVAANLARRKQAELIARLKNTSQSTRRLYYRKHLDLLLEGVSSLERGRNAAANNIEYYQKAFEKFLKEAVL